jgi:undecaprenyl-diphosphatase
MFIYILLGILQGLLEWIPISSEGVVALVSQIFSSGFNPVNIALFLHLGTLFAVLIYFRKDWIKVLTLKDKRLLRFLIISGIFSLIVGYPVYIAIKNIAIGNSLLLLTGLGLLLTAYFHKANKALEISSDKLAILTGSLQGLAVIPGLSRSGSTIFGLSLNKSNPSEVLRISYMMSFPAILSSSIFLSVNNPQLILSGWISLIFSFLVGLLSLHFLLKLVSKINFFKFALIFAFLCIIGSLIGFFL